MKYEIITVNDKNNIITYIKYNNGKKIELFRNKNYKFYTDETYIFLLDLGHIVKVFDINNKRFLNNTFEMKILYNKYVAQKRRDKYEKKKILTNN